MGSNHRVEGEEGRVLRVIKDLIGIMEIVGVIEGYGGYKLAYKLRVVKKTVNEQLGMNLLQLSQRGAWLYHRNGWVFHNAS